MDRYSNEFKALVTKRARKTRNIKQTARIYGVPYSTVKRWMSLAVVPVAWTPYKVAWSTLQAASTGTGRDQKTAASWPIFP